MAEALGLERQLDVDARYLSHGDKKRLEIALALALEPQVLMMDEPTAGMSPSDRQRTVALVNELRSERGITLIVIEHDMDVVFGLADRVMVLNYGETIALGSVDEVKANPAVRDVYLGKEMSVA
jgi:branched-chain amino acid transport system ATP-binding protein